ncbi:MAG: RDD family protein, partial [Thioalkalivibrio sp.]|nr:RDD family protein [Thioalkalivibrio sp.]
RKRLFGLRVVDFDGERISFARATGRHFASILSGLTLGIGYIMVAFTRRRQALHDLIAQTLVVRKEWLG